MVLNVTVRSRGEGAFVVYPAGALNSDTSPMLEQHLTELMALQPRLVVLDLAELDYMSSAGIRVLLKAKKELKAARGKLSFMHLRPPIRKVFDIINALPSLSIFASVEEMDEYLDAMQRETDDGEVQR